jgi:glutamine amidotransferase
MCRHLAYLGPPATLAELIIDPPRGLYRQSWEPRYQRHGTVNADGFGAGWYADGDPLPARYRRAAPIWAAGTESGASAAAPYGAGQWLFSHNGTLDGWPGSAAGLAATLLPGDLLALEARCDSALLWALVLRRLRDGADPGDALAGVIGLLDAQHLTGRFNFLLTDGRVIAATAAGHSLWYRRTAPAEGEGPSVVVASEPSDDGPGWAEVPDRCLVTASTAGVRVRPLLPPEGDAGASPRPDPAESRGPDSLGDPPGRPAAARHTERLRGDSPREQRPQAGRPASSTSKGAIASAPGQAEAPLHTHAERARGPRPYTSRGAAACIPGQAGAPLHVAPLTGRFPAGSAGRGDWPPAGITARYGRITRP